MSSASILRGEAGKVTGNDPLVPWWSFTKTALAGAALALVDRRKISLDTPLGRFNYTLRHLLQHTSGLPDYGGVREYQEAVAAGREPWTREKLLLQSNADGSLFTPGTSWSYSNIGYLFVREIIQETIDQDLNEALRVLVLEPLGIENVFVARTRDDLRSTPWGRETDYHPGWVFHGLLVGPPSAAASLLHGLLFGDLLSAALKAEMLAVRPLGGSFSGRPAVNPSYGLGVMMGTASPVGRMVGHTGTWA